MAIPIPVDASKVPASIEDRTWRVQIECEDGQPYTLQFFRQNLSLNASGETVSKERTDDFTLTLDELQQLASTHPELQPFFAIPNLVKGLCDAIAVISRQST